MAEAAAALASLGVAANIFQFLGLGGKIAVKGWKIYHDPDGKIEDVFDGSTLENLTASLRGNLTSLTPDERECGLEMGVLAANCAKVADRLLEHLERVGNLKRSGKKRGALKAAVMSVWKQYEIKALEARLEQFRSEFTIQLLLSIRSYVAQSNIPERQEDSCMLHETQSATAGVINELQALHTTIKDPRTSTPGLRILQQVSSRTSPSESKEVLGRLRPHIFAAISANEGDVSRIYRLSDASSGEFVDISDSSSSESFDTSDKSVSAKLRDIVLEVLDSDVMNDRQSQVSIAHAMTFRWIFLPPSARNSPLSNFSEWLRDADASLYWVTGKPGSGKSTLMKFILTYEGDGGSGYDTEVQNLLSRADEEPSWTIVNYFAWYAGQKLQRSIDGLCRSLIYQLLKSHPNVLNAIFPSCWEALWLVDDLGPQQMKTVQSLRVGERTILLNVVHEVIKTHKVFFLIDGLDEIDGETEEASDLVLDLAGLPNVKVCTSSRPWPVFEDAFCQKPNLTMQDLTQSDIRTFVKDGLHQSNGFMRLQRQHPEYASGLIDQVAQKSAGVFLWVALVVKSLQRGLRKDDRIVDLEQRIDELPNDLDMLFTRIIGGLDNKRLKRARQYFGLLAIHQHHYPEQDLMALAFSFADEEYPSFAMSMALETLSDDEVDMRVGTMSRRVESVSRGLLEVVKSSSQRKYKVDYLHRTIVEYLRSGTAHQALLMTNEPSKTVELDIQLLSAYLCLLKDLKEDEQSRLTSPTDGFKSILFRILLFASQADKKLSDEDTRHAQIVEILHQTDLVGRKLARFAATIPAKEEAADYKAIQATFESGHWALNHGNLHIESMIQASDRSLNPSGRSFLSMVVRSGICSYVRERQTSLVQRLDEAQYGSGLINHSIWPLLADALNATPVSLRMIRQLLQLGADPGHLFYLPAISEKTTPLRMAIAKAGESIAGKGKTFRTPEEVRAVLTEMVAISKRENLPKKEEAQLISIVQDIIKPKRAGRRS